VGIALGDWNEAFLQEAEKFPRGKYKDQIDGASGAFNKLAITWEELQSIGLDSIAIEEYELSDY
jgi:phage terminase large subunit-like protein